MKDLIKEYEKIMNSLTPILVADKLKQIKKEFDNIKNKTKWNLQQNN